MTPNLRTELWTSSASLLRSYSAANGLKHSLFQRSFTLAK